jgi:hypothetical protein
VIERRERDFKEWPIDSVTPYNPSAFTGESGIHDPRRLVREKFASAKEIFRLFFDAAVMALLMDSTNASGRTKWVDWSEIEHSEFEALLGTLILMSLCPMPDMRLYWHNTFGWDPVRAIWSRDRFLRRYWALSIHDDPSLPLDTATLEAGPPLDRLRVVQPLGTRLNERFMAVMSPGRELTGDESMIKYRGPHPSFQMMRGKPIPRGFKLWTLSDIDGYTFATHLYLGRTGDAKIDVGSLTRAITDLMEHFYGCYRVVFTDSAFTSKELADLLLTNKTLIVGKVSQSRRFPLHVKEGTLERGQYLTVQNALQPALTATAFQDKRHHLFTPLRRLYRFNRSRRNRLTGTVRSLYHRLSGIITNSRAALIRRIVGQTTERYGANPIVGT